MIEEDDPITRLGKERGCVSCGKKTDVFYWIEYYLLPTKLVRKRHREKERAALYCRRCYESDPNLHFEIDGKHYSVPQTSSNDFKNIYCIVCNNETKDSRQLHGVVTSLLMMGGSGIENYPLAFLCSKCVEDHELNFLCPP